MKGILTIAFAAALLAPVLLAPAPAGAGERVFDGVLGGASGGIVFGPVGLVAGGLTGYVAGPNIARGMGLSHRRHTRHVRR